MHLAAVAAGAAAPRQTRSPRLTALAAAKNVALTFSPPLAFRGKRPTAIRPSARPDGRAVLPVGRGDDLSQRKDAMRGPSPTASATSQEDTVCRGRARRAAPMARSDGPPEPLTFPRKRLHSSRDRIF